MVQGGKNVVSSASYVLRDEDDGPCECAEREEQRDELCPVPAVPASHAFRVSAHLCGNGHSCCVGDVVGGDVYQEVPDGDGVLVADDFGMRYVLQRETVRQGGEAAEDGEYLAEQIQRSKYSVGHGEREFACKLRVHEVYETAVGSSSGIVCLRVWFRASAFNAFRREKWRQPAGSDTNFLPRICSEFVGGRAIRAYTACGGFGDVRVGYYAQEGSSTHAESPSTPRCHPWRVCVLEQPGSGVQLLSWAGATRKKRHPSMST